MYEAGKTVQAHCNRCVGEKNSIVLYIEAHPWDELYENEYPISGSETWVVLKCAGCDQISLLHESWFSEHTDTDGSTIIKKDYFPPVISRRKPDWWEGFEALLNVPERLSSIMDECYIAYQNNARQLTAMGFRAIIESVCRHQKCEAQNFNLSIKNLCEKGLISSSQQSVLEKVLEVGHAGVHREYVPPMKQISACMDIIETLIETIYVHPAFMSELSQVPERKKKL